MTGLIDGMGGEEVNQDTDVQTETLSGTNVYGVSGTFNTVTSSNAELTDVSNDEGELQSVSVGSNTAVYGAKIQAGSGLLVGSTAVIVFPVSFTQKPAISVTDLTTVSTAINVGSNLFSAGSFTVECEAGTDEFSWIAVGL